MMCKSMRLCWATLLLLAFAAQAEVKVPAIFSSHMVLQADQECPVWGWADAGEDVTVEFAGQKLAAKPDGSGKWMARLAAMKANANGQVLTIRGKNTITLEDVLVGEVWLCSGQSNMEFTVRQSDNSKDELASANHPRIRHIKLQHRPSDKPMTDVPSTGWEVCTPTTVGNFTAAGYFFGRQIMKDLDVPIGLIGSNWGGTRIEPWTPPEGFKQVPALKDITDKLDTFPAKAPDKKDATKMVINHQSPLALYNGMIFPLVPYTIRGALWYQGESNNGEGMLYFEKMKALIGGWREVWKKPDLPFYYVQIAPYTYKSPEKLPGLWESQQAALSIPNTGMANTMDIGNVKNIHPTNKQEVGRRLALWALAKTYGKPQAVLCGPLYKSCKIDGNKVRISFDFVGGGLTSRDGKPLTFFTIAGEDKNFVEAKAEIEGETVVVSSDKVAKPVAVRFGWTEIAEPNLANKEGLPASPFRTEK
ncbi:MAG TPA: sialate O-acetylesterase [Planctomycetota bacterium]|jgi:sialate O-acetylesterase